jgi:hypothetical protein
MPDDRVLQGTNERRPAQAIFQQVVLRSGLDGPAGHLRVVHTGPDQHRRSGRVHPHRRERLQSAAIGKRDAHQDGVESPRADRVQALNQRRGVLDHKDGAVTFAEFIAHGVFIAGLFADQQNSVRVTHNRSFS